MERRSRFEPLRRRLAQLGEDELVHLVESGAGRVAGIGGTRSTIMIDDVMLFVKRVPLTELENRTEHRGSTANLFDLPVWCQYGVRSPGFTVWREVAANVQATEWVASGLCESFPMLFHWRILNTGAFDGPLPDELGDLEALVSFYHGSRAVRRRAEAIAEASKSVVLLFEFIPGDFSQQLTSVSAGASGGLDALLAELQSTMLFMNRSGLFHFDTHLGNLVADEYHPYLVDFGLAASTSYDNSPVEAQFLAANRSHDVAYLTTRIVNFLVAQWCESPDPLVRNAVIRRVATGNDPALGLPEAARRIVQRFALVAVHMNEFYAALHTEDRRTPYPTAKIEAAWAETGSQASY